MRALIVASLATLAACTMPARLYTEDGRVIPASFTWNGVSGTGRVYGVFPDGERFEGEYFTEANVASSVGFTVTPWGPITTVSAAQVGPQVSHTTAVGASGTMIQCVSYPRGSSGFGGCRDSKRRQYRLHY